MLRSATAWILSLAFVFSSPLATLADTLVDCGTHSDWIEFGPESCQTNPSYPTAHTAERAAQSCLKALMLAAQDIDCDRAECRPTSCYSSIEYQAPEQLEVNSYYDEHEGQWVGTAKWTGGLGRLHCSDCIPI